MEELGIHGIDVKREELGASLYLLSKPVQPLD